jgi:dTDP-4-dehydrorhamnose 3,5-epimerase
MTSLEFVDQHLENKMKFNESKMIKGLVIIQPEIFHDYRGEFIETYNQTAYDHLIKPAKFIIDDISVSRQKTMRGLHGDNKTIKLIQCLYGDILQVVIDLRIGSPTFLQYQTFAINEKNRTQLLIPAGCGNGHIVLSEKAIFSYKQTEYYGGEGSQFQYEWSQFILDFPIRLPFHPRDAILSERDANGMTLFETLDWLNPDIKQKKINSIVGHSKPNLVREYSRRRKHASY